MRTSNSIRWLVAGLWAVSSVAVAQEPGAYAKALAAFNAGNYDLAAQKLFEVTETSTDAETRAKAEYYLAQSLAKKGLPLLAHVYFRPILKAGKSHPYYLKAVEGLVNAQEALNDQYLIPSLLNQSYSDEWATLPLEVLSRINFLVAGISQRKGRFEEARAFLEAVPKESTVYAKAQYLLGLILLDPRLPGGAKVEDAVAAFERVLALSDPRQKDLISTQQLSLLGIGRTWYGAGEYKKSVAAYERVPRFSKFWDQSLFENGFARFQNDDLGGALGSLQALHAPQFAGAFQPESWVLKATVYYFSCLHEEARAALGAFDEVYLPMHEKLKGIVDNKANDDAAYYAMVEKADSERVPKPVLNWVRGNERMLGVVHMLDQLEIERRAVNEIDGWKAVKLADQANVALNETRNVLVQTGGRLARNRFFEAAQNIKLFTDQAEIIRFETSKAEKELAEAGVNRKALLSKQALYRPKMPAENWNYWKFQGEFWRDEIGYYQYTLKRGCPVAAE